MIRLREMTLEREGFDVRGLAFLLIGAFVAGTLVWIAIAPTSGGYPQGVIGYQQRGVECWVDARGDAVQPPPTEPARAAVVEADSAGTAFAAPAGDATAYVCAVDEGARFLTRLVVRTGD
jgi:hypothetical protein